MQKCMVNIYGVQPEQFSWTFKMFVKYKQTFEYIYHVPTDNIRVWASIE